MQTYFDQHGGVAPFGENEILYAAYYHVAKRQLYPGFIDYSGIRRVVAANRKPGGGWQAYSTTDTWSHDNHTGTLTLMQLIGNTPTWGDIFPGDFWRRLHPRDLVTWLSIKIPPVRWILGWIPAAAHIVACLRKYESDGVTLATSGKLRAWLYINTHNAPLTRWACNAIIKKRGGWHDVFLYYFKDDSHPVVVLSKELK